MQFQRKGKKENQDNASRLDEANVSIHSGLNVDSYRRGRETTGRHVNYPMMRGEELDKSTTESGYRETLFLDRDDVMRRHHNMSPITEGRQTLGLYVPGSRSPGGQYGRQSVISSVRQDLNERQDTAQIVGKKPIPTLTVQIPFRKEDQETLGERRAEGSPKVIQLAGNDEYATRSLNFRRSPEQTRPNFQYGLNTINPDYTGNLLVDQPVNVLGSFVQSGENFYTIQSKALPKSSSNHNLKDPRERDREIHFQPDRNVNNSREIYEDRQTLKSKMSPNRNMEQEGMYLERQADFEDPRKMEKLKDLKRITNLVNKNDLDNTDPNDQMMKMGSNSYERPYMEVDNLYKTYAPDIENLMKMKQMRDSENYKKFQRQFTKGFEPQKKEGRLISNRQTIVNPVNDQIFPERRQVMQKMNKLSHILMSKSRSVESLNRSMGPMDEDLNSSNFNRNTIRERTLGGSNPPETGRKTYALNRSPQQKFIRVTMAMLSSKGPNCEDRIITRVMRYEKGGVVDLAQSTQKNKKYEVRKVRRKGEKSTVTPRRFNLKDRERASKIVQAWWREILNKYKNFVDKIKKIQSVWRGHWLRKYLYYIVYMTIIMQTFLDRLNGPSARATKREVFDKLLPFAVKYRARRNLTAIIKIQRQAREFLDRMRNKRTRMALLLHKLFERRKVATMNTLRKHANACKDNKLKSHKNKENNAENLIKRTKKAMRVRIFHDLLFKVFNRPVSQLKSSLFHHLLKTNFRKFRHILIKEYFMRWMKKSLRTPDDSPEAKTIKLRRASNQLCRSLLRPILNDVMDKLKGLQKKQIRHKVIKRLVRNADKYKDIILKDYFRRWAEVPKKMLAKEFKNQLSGKLLLKTARLSEMRNLHKRFRDWRDKKIPAKDLVPFINGGDKLKNFVRKRVHDKVMPLTSVQGVKGRLLKTLMRKSSNFNKIPLRHYYNKWKNFVSKARNMELSARLVRRLGNKAFKNNLHRILLKRLLDWRRKANIEKILEAEHKVPVIVEVPKEVDNHRKYFATVKIVSGTEKLAKRAALKAAMPPIKRYLDNQTLQKGVKKMLFMNPKLNRIALKNSWNHYLDQVKKLRQKEVRDKMFDKLVNKNGSKFKETLLRKYLRKWFRNLPKGVEIKYFNGSDLLQKAMWRRNVRKPIEAFKQKIDVDNAKNGILKAFGLKSKYILRHWREYLYKWKKNSDKLRLKQTKNDLVGKLFATLLTKFRNRILSNRFSHWRKVPKINMKDIFDRYKAMNDVVKRTVNYCLKPKKQEFLKGVQSYTGNKAYRRALNRLGNLAINGQNIKLKSAFDRWRNKCKDCEIYDLKLRLLRYSVGQEGIKNRKKSLASAFNKWLRNTKLENLLRHSDKNLIIYKGVNNLAMLVNRRRTNFMTRLHRLMNMDSRGVVLFNIYKRLQRPRNSMSRCFDRWRRENEHYNKHVLTKNYTTRLLDKSCAKVRRRQLRDSFVQYFIRWRNMLKKPEDYYLRIADATHKVDKFLKTKACPPAFNALADHKNYKKYFLKILPSTTRLTERMNRNSLLRCWNKWKKDVSDGRVEKYRATILDKLTTKIGQRRRNNRLAKAFHKWGNIKPKSLHFPHVVKASDKVLNTLQRRYRKPIFDNLQKNCAAKTKRNGLMMLFGKSKTFNDHKLRNYFKKWWKNTLLNVDGIKNRVMRNVKRFVVENHIMSPLEKYFRRWLRNMIEKPKNFNDYVKGADKLRTALVKKGLKEPLKTLKHWRSPDALKRALFNKVLPKSKKLMRHYISNSLHQWKKNVDRQKLAEMQAKLLNTVYIKGKNALQKRFLKRYMDRWRYKEENKPVDFARIIGGEKKWFDMFVNKYLKDGFMPNLKDYSEKKFLRSLLLKNSRFHQRALEPFFKRWKTTAYKMKDRQTQADLVGRLIAKTRNYFANKDIKELLKKKFDQWKNNIRNYDKKVNEIVPKANDLVKKNTLKKMFPELIKPLKAKKLKSQRREKLVDVEDIGLKVLTNHLRNAIRRWKDQVHKLQMRELRNKTMQSHLKVFSKRMDQNRLLRCFLTWKGLMLGKSNIRSALIGANTLTRLFARKPFQTFKDRTKMMNLKIPYGMPLASVLIRHNPHVAKSVAIRNLSMRPSFNKWKKNVDKIKAQEIKEDAFKKLFYPHMRNKGKVVLRKAFNRWRDVMAEEDKRNLQAAFHSRILFNIYDKNHLLCLRHFYNLWKDSTNANLKRLNDISLGVVKLRHQLGRKIFHDLYAKLYVQTDVFPRFDMIKKILLNALRNNDKGNMLYCWSRWKKHLHSDRERKLKHKILCNLVRADNQRIDDYDKNKLHECLLKWRINAAPKDYYDTINRIRVGTHLLHRGLTKKFNRDVFDKIKGKARKENINNALYSFISNFDKKADNHILRERFKHWRTRLGDTDKELKRLKRLANTFHKSSDIAHNELIKKPVDDLTECMRAWVAFKTNKANTIQDYCKNLLFIFKRMKLVQRNRNLHKLFSNLNMKMAIKSRLLFARWMKNANLLNADGKARKIQSFLRGKRDAVNNKRNRVRDGLEPFERFVKRKTFNDLWLNGRMNRKRQLLLRLMKDTPDEVKLEFLKKYFNRWWGVILSDREHAAGTMIVSVLRGFLTRKFKNLLLKRRAKMNEVVKKLFLKYLDKRRLYFNKWMLDNRMAQIEQASKVINGFLKGRLLNLKEARAKINLLDLFRKGLIKKLHRAMDSAAKINGDRGLIMYDTLKDIFIQRPFDKIKDGAKWIGRLRKLHHVYPRITRALKNHWLPHYLRKWKERTYDDMINKIVRLQNWFRARLLLWRARIQAKKASLVQKYITKLTKDTDLIQKLAVKNWAKKAKIGNLHTKAAAVQAIWRGNTSRRNVDRILNVKKMNNFFRKVTLRRLCDDLTKCSDYTEPIKRNLANMNSGIEKRYVTNNLMDLANNAIRNAYMYKLTNKRAFLGDMSRLREYFNRFKRFAGFADEAAKKLQSRYRQFLAKKQLNNMLRHKDLLLKIYGKYDQTEMGKLKIAFTRWNNRANQLRINHSSKVIQDYVKLRNARWQNTKMKNFFMGNAVRLAEKRINNVAKTDKFKTTLQKHALRIFIERLGNKKKAEKFLWIFGRRFQGLDDQLKNMYLKKYLDDWNDKSKRIRNQEFAAALALTKMFRGNLARKFVAKLLKKKERMTYLMLRLIDDNDTKKRMFLRMWYNRMRADKLEESAKVLQKFMGDVKQKNERIKSQRKLNRLHDGFERAHNAWLQAAPANAIHKIKSQANRKLVQKVGDDIENKKTDHLKTAFDNIRDFGDNKYGVMNHRARKIQQKFNLFKNRKSIWNTIEKIRKLRMILRMMGDRGLRMKNKVFKVWRRNALGDKWHSSAQTIQNFLSDRVLRWRKGQKVYSMEKLYMMFRNHLVNHQLRPYFRDFVNTVKINQFNDHMGRYIFNKFRYNVFNYEKLNYLNKLFRLPVKISKKILSKWFDRWRNTADYLKKHEGAMRIQKNFKNFKFAKKKRLMSDKMEKIIMKLAFKNDDKRKYYFTLWKRNAQNLKVEENAKIIQNFVMGNYNRIKIKKQWWNLTNQMFIKHNILSGLNFWKRYKQWRGLRSIFNVIDHKIKRDGFDDLQNKGKHRKILQLTKAIFGNFEKRNETLALWHYWRKWQNKIGKLHERDRALENMADVFDLRSKIIAAKAVNDASLVKKTFFYIEKIRAKDAMKNLKWRAGNKDKLKNFGENLRKADDDLNNKNINLFANKLYRLYIYKILDNLNKSLSNFQQNVIKPKYGNFFIHKLHNNFISGSKENYDNERSSGKMQKPKLFTFKAEVKNAKKEQMLLMEKNPTKYMVPHLVNFLDALKKRRLRLANDNLKKNHRASKFFDLLKKHINKEITDPKKDLLKGVKDQADYNAKTPQLIGNLADLLRKYYIRKTTEALVPVSQRHRLMYLVRVTLMNREMSNRRHGKEVLRKWRFIAFMKKLAKQKLEAMYKNMHLNYLNMAKEVFGEEESNPGMIKHFEMFGSNMGMFSNVDLREYEENKKKHYKTVSKKFTFEPVEMHYDGEESHYDENSMYNRYSIVGDNPEYYYDEGIGDATQGRYKVDTDMSGSRRK